jgi:pilus assembly protein CpaB
VKVVEYPVDLVPPGAITSIADAVDRVVLHPMVKDEVLVEGKLASKDAGRGLAAIIPEGMRAFTIQTPHVASGVAGFILPGNKVDVLLTMNGQGSNDTTGGASTSTLLQNVKILAVDQRTDAPVDNKVNPQTLQSVTLLVTPDQAAKLDLGQNRGTLHLSLRNPKDTDAATTRPATLSGLQFSPEKPWRDQAREMIAALTKLIPERKAKAPKLPFEPEEPAKPLEIRTLRGRQSGLVQIEVLSATVEER